jgi:prepilin-type N-terminal cleavage/methylation domain-containing protein
MRNMRTVQGFSIVELLVALAIIGVILASVSGIFINCRKHQQRSLAVTQSLYLAKSLLAMTEMTPPENRMALPSSGDLPDTPQTFSYRWSRTMQILPEGPTKARVEVEYFIPPAEKRSIVLEQEFYP